MIFEDIVTTVDDAPSNSGSRGTQPDNGEQFHLCVHRPRHDVTLIEVTGSLDMTTLSRFDEIVRERLNSTCPRLVLDLSGVTFLSVNGIETLLQTQRRARAVDKHLMLVTGAHAVDRPLHALGLTTRFTYCDPPLLAAEPSIDTSPVSVLSEETVQPAPRPQPQSA